MTMAKKIKVVLSLIGVDGHDRGLRIVATILRDAGMEVVYLGQWQTPESVVKTAIQEDADVVGISFLCGHHLHFVPKIKKMIDKNGLDNLLFIVGGVIPEEDVDRLKALGVDEVFRSGNTASFVEYVQNNVKGK